MTAIVPPAPPDRILQAALTLLEQGGVGAVSTRAVSAAAAVQPPTIYRHFGDMQGLLGAVASLGFAAYLQSKAAQDSFSDPVAQLRAGWDSHVDFGLNHPHLYTLMYAGSQLGEATPAAVKAAGMLRQLMARVAQTGRLALDTERAAALMHAAALGTTLSLLAARERDEGFSGRMLDAVLNTLLLPGERPGAGAPERQVSAHAVALVALLPTLSTPFSGPEAALLTEWLRRLI